MNLFFDERVRMQLIETLPTLNNDAPIFQIELYVVHLYLVSLCMVRIKCFSSIILIDWSIIFIDLIGSAFRLIWSQLERSCLIITLILPEIELFFLLSSILDRIKLFCYRIGGGIAFIEAYDSLAFTKF